jgi:hypothetical protein
MDKGRVAHRYNGILTNHKKEWNVVICNTVDRLGGYYVKWNKSDRERQNLYGVTYMQNLKMSNS